MNYSRKTKAQLIEELDELKRKVRDLELLGSSDMRMRQIAAHEEAEADVEDNRAILGDAIEALGEGIVIFDAEARMVLCNSKYREFYAPVAGKWRPGTPLDQMVSEAAQHCLGLEGEALEAWVRADREAHKGHEPRIEHHSNGRWIRLTEYPLANGWAVGIRSDITEVKLAEEALKAREAQLNHAQRMVKLGVFVWDNVTDEAIYYSDGLADLLGMSDEQMRKWGDSHESTLEQVEPDDRAHYHRVIRESERTVGAYDVEYRVRNAVGKLRHWREMGEPVADDQGRLIRTIGTIQDITDAKVSEERLHQAQKMEAVGQLTGGVAHDFNNLLAVIMGNTELLEARLGKEDTALASILRAGTRGSELTQRLLAFSRQQPLKPQVIDLGALVSGMTQMLTRTLGEAIEIKIVVASNLWITLADPGQVENALLNLAINARDAMLGSGKLTVECANAWLDKAYVDKNPEAKAGDYLLLAVSDSGIGMTAEVQAHAFEPFFTTKDVGQGSGLGLSMVYGFAKQSGGHVSIYSEEGMGTTVKLYLPRAEEAARLEGTSQKQDVPQGKGEVVLVIEDDPDVRDLAIRLLEGLNYRVIAALNAKEAHRALSAGTSVDLVLSDVVLPGGVSGPAFAEEARTTFPDLKVIFMSGYPTEAARRNGFLGSDSVLLSKPFRRQQLAKVLRQALG